MLNGLTIENFKPFGSSQFARLAPITLVYGPNSSGKSSLIQALLMMKQTLIEKNVDGKNDLVMSGPFVNLGSFSSLIHQHDCTRNLKIIFHFSDSEIRNSDLNLRSLGLSFANTTISGAESIPFLKEVDFDLKNNERSFCSFTVGRDDVNNPYRLMQSTEFKNLSQIVEHMYNLRMLSPDITNNDNFRLPVDKNFDPSQEDLDFLAALRFQPGQYYLPVVLRLDAEWYNQHNLDQDCNQFEDVPPAHELDDDEHHQIDDAESAYYTCIAPPDHTENEFADSGSREIFDPCDRLESQRIENPIRQDGLKAILLNAESKLANEIGSLNYLGPLRTYPERLYALQGLAGETVGPRGQQAVQLLYHDLQANQNGDSLIQRLNQYCRNFEIPYEFSIRYLGDEIAGQYIVLSLVDVRIGVNVAPTDVGFGIGQIMPVLVEGMVAQQSAFYSPLICVEQPEIHLHPRLQAAMADFFLDTAGLSATSEGENDGAKKSVQWILETHSETLMLRIQRRIREGKLSPRDVSVLYVDPRCEQGSVIKELRLDEDGEFIDEWPDGFFDEGFNELFGGGGC